MLRAAPCPPRLPTGAAGGAVAPPRPKYVRYSDPALQNAYANVVAGVSELTIPIYGRVFNDETADKLATNLIDAVRRLPQSTEIQERVRCEIGPALEAAVRAEVGKIVLGTLAAGFAVMSGISLMRVVRR